jgi:hypothetical protein
VQQVRLRDLQGWDAWALAELDAGFDRYATPGKPFIDPALVQQDISALEAVITHAIPTRARPSRIETMMSGAGVRGFSRHLGRARRRS